MWTAPVVSLHIASRVHEGKVYSRPRIALATGTMSKSLHFKDLCILGKISTRKCLFAWGGVGWQDHFLSKMPMNIEYCILLMMISLIMIWNQWLSFSLFLIISFDNPLRVASWQTRDEVYFEIRWHHFGCDHQSSYKKLPQAHEEDFAWLWFRCVTRSTWRL